MIFFVFLVNFKLLFTHHYPETYKPKFILVQRFVNNYTNRVGCGFECAGIKTQA